MRSILAAAVCLLLASGGAIAEESAEAGRVSRARYDDVMAKMMDALAVVYESKYGGLDAYEREVEREISREKIAGAPDPEEKVLGVGRDQLDKTIKRLRSRDNFEEQRAFIRRMLAKYGPEFEKHGIPKDFWTIPYVESAFDKRACTYAETVKAYVKGMWQFIPSTAQQYGLKTTTKACTAGEAGDSVMAADDTDQRADLTLSAKAAAQFLAELRKEFKKPELVLTAYHSGPANTRGMIEKYGDDFWSWKKDPAFQFGTRSRLYAPLGLAWATLIKE
jgi:hypothetical protein